MDPGYIRQLSYSLEENSLKIEIVSLSRIKIGTYIEIKHGNKYSMRYFLREYRIKDDTFQVFLKSLSNILKIVW